MIGSTDSTNKDSVIMHNSPADKVPEDNLTDKRTVKTADTADAAFLKKAASFYLLLSGSHSARARLKLFTVIWGIIMFVI